jgi:hypothetical protein
VGLNWSGGGRPSRLDTRRRQLAARCVPAALDRPSDAHRLASPARCVNGHFVNIRYPFLTCHLRCQNRTQGLHSLRLHSRTRAGSREGPVQEQASNQPHRH